MSIWAEDGVYQIGPQGAPATGIEAIRKTVHGIWAGISNSHHYTTNVVINLIDKTNAEGRGDVFDTHYGGDGTPTIVAASYTDKFIKIKGHWKISYRLITIYFAGPAAEVWNLRGDILMDLTSFEHQLKSVHKCLDCTWKQVDICDLKQYDKDSCPVEQKVREIVGIKRREQNGFDQ